MRTEPLFNLKPKRRRRWQLVSLAILITGILSMLAVVVTIYGQFTGTFLIKMNDDAELKGIHLSESGDFTDATEKLSLTPKSEMIDILFENIVFLDDILNAPGGQFEDPYHDDEYIAYNFFIKNTGKETINLKYDITITESKNKLEDALVLVLYRQGEGIKEPIKEVYHKSGSRRYLGGDIIYNFRPGDVFKYTFISYIDGTYSTEEMLAGAVKVNLVFKIDSARDEGE